MIPEILKGAHTVLAVVSNCCSVANGRFHALLTRLPLPPKRALDLHVLSLPPAFVLSQDQTLKLKI